MVMNMVDRNQLGLLNSLNQRAAQIQSWLNVVKRDAKITAMTLTVTEQPETDEESGAVSSVTIPTADIATPPQMMAAIETQLQSNYEELVKRMTELGVSTNVVAQAQPPQPHTPQPEHRPPPPRSPPKPPPKQAPKPNHKPTSHRR